MSENDLGRHAGVKPEPQTMKDIKQIAAILKRRAGNRSDDLESLRTAAQVVGSWDWRGRKGPAKVGTLDAKRFPAVSRRKLDARATTAS